MVGTSCSGVRGNRLQMNMVELLRGLLSDVLPSDGTCAIWIMDRRAPNDAETGQAAGARHPSVDGRWD